LNAEGSENCSITTVNFGKNNRRQTFNFSIDDENNAISNYSPKVLKYLYEPNVAILKSGAFKSFGSKLSLHKLHVNTHLYTSSELLLNIPARAFIVSKVWGNSKQELKELSATHPTANITIRNYPLSVAELRKKLNIKDGGEVYLFATTLANDNKVIIECKKP
jgi:hypothetical protein